jgi:hypothetical protein
MVVTEIYEADFARGRRTNFFWHPFCRINAAFHRATERRIYAAAKKCVVHLRALNVRSKIATRQRFVSFFMQKARDPTAFFAAQKNTFFFKLLMVCCLHPVGSSLARPTLKSSPAMVGTFAF